MNSKIPEATTVGDVLENHEPRTSIFVDSNAQIPSSQDERVCNLTLTKVPNATTLREWVEVCPNVTSIYFLTHSAPAKGLAALAAAWPAIDRIAVCHGLGKGGGKSLALFPNLTHLQLSGKGVDNTAVKQVASGCTLLRVVKIEQEWKGSRDKGPVKDSSLVALIQANPGLEEACLSYTALTDATLEALGESAPCLTSLDVSRRPVSDQGLASLAAGCPALSTLLLLSDQVTDAGVEAIASLPLTTLNLCYAAVTHTGLASLAATPSLTHLDLQGVALTDAAVAAVASACQSLVRLSFPRDTSVSKKAHTLANAINAPPSSSRQRKILKSLAALQRSLS